MDLSNLGVDKKKVAVNYLFDDEQGEFEVHRIQDPDAGEPDDEDFEVLLAAVNDLEGEDSETKVEISEAEAKEILMAMVKGKPRPRSFQGAMKVKKNRDLARGYGAGRNGSIRPGTYKVSIEELQKRTRCH